jgi:hypothetical protein
MMNDRQTAQCLFFPFFFCVPPRPDEACIVILILIMVLVEGGLHATPTNVSNGWYYDEIVKGFKLVDQKPCNVAAWWARFRSAHHS